MRRNDDEPRLVFADERGQVLDEPGLRAAGRSGRRFAPLDPARLIPLPEGSELYLLPARAPLGFRGGEREVRRGSTAVAAFLPSGYSVSALAAYESAEEAPLLPLFAYAAVCWYRGAFHAPARRVEPDVKHDPASFAGEDLDALVARLAERCPKNRLIEHLGKMCAQVYGCANARNLFHERWECPVPLAPACNARCVGCISAQPDAPIPSPQERLTFVPRVDEVLEFAVPHLERAPRAMVSFGQGCEGEPLTQGELLLELVRKLREKTRRGTLHLNTNGSRPALVARLIEAGLDSVRVSLNSARAEPYARYYRPLGYAFADVVESVRVARRAGAFASLNLLAFPGFTDTEAELEALCELARSTGLDMIQWRNLNVDPELYVDTVGLGDEPALGMDELFARLEARLPDLAHGYVNPPREAWPRARSASARIAR